MESALLLWKACCLFWIRSFKCFIIQGACVFMGTFLTGIIRSRPVYITCSKTQSNSLLVLKELSNRGQSNEHRYLPVSAFWLGCRLRLKFNLSGPGQYPLFSSEARQIWYCDQIEQKVERSAVCCCDCAS